MTNKLYYPYLMIIHQPLNIFMYIVLITQKLIKIVLAN